MKCFKNHILIGEGTFGKVYKTNTPNPVAIKHITCDIVHGFPFTAIREIKILKSIKHPNIVSLSEITSTPESLYISMEYLPFDLSGLISLRYNFKNSHLVSISYQLLRALSHLHSLDYIHRDVKPSNILLNYDGTVKLADFGLTRKKNEMMTNRVCTLWYRAPELLLGSTTYDAKIDAWSVGLILLEIKKVCFFKGRDEIDQAVCIFTKLGAPADVYKWSSMFEIEKYKIDRNWDDIIFDEFGALFEYEMLVLVGELLRLNPVQRLSPENALKLSIFMDVKIEEIGEIEERHELSFKEIKQVSEL
ncbi:kinase subunit of RNA polymerase II carboxy-terminal domain kinase I [Conglomerata obtusa]